LKPLPAPPVTLLATFATVQQAGAACSAALRVLTPSLMELMDRATLAAVSRGRNLGVDVDVEVMLVAQVDSPGAAGLAEAELMEQICVAHGAIDVMTSSDPAESEMLLAARRFAYAAIEELGRTMSDDVAIPRSKIADFLLGVEKIAVEHQVHICSFGHAGDGNMHPTIVVPHGDEAAAVAMFAAFEAILRLARSLGGTVTGEHGVGLLKVPYLGEEIGPISAALQHGIKAVFDPTGLLNPGKSFPA
jgi:glycolate oxidase